MIRITMKIDGMMCGMCEAHMNDAIRQAFKIKKVTSSHSKNESVIITENDISEQELAKTVEKTGYKLLDVKKEPYEKKGLFSFLKK
ncbi:MAG: heavy-metal-associated domain-containing protein [Clostridia bacterium]|nr:heavy-metal-associated domain-containing protein [Clostridia bacterium]